MAYSYALRPVSDIDPTRTYRVVFWIGLGALAGWPFTALIGIPFAMEEVLIFGRDTMKKADGTVVQSIGGPRWRLRRVVRLFEAALLIGLGLTVSETNRQEERALIFFSFFFFRSCLYSWTK